jgi:hypothetical protein
MKKIIFVSYIKLSDRVSQDWAIDYLISKGMRVEYWDVVQILRGDFSECGTKTTDYLHIFHTYRELRAALSLPENNSAYFVMMVSYSGQFAGLFRLLSKLNCKMILITWGALPSPDAQQKKILVQFVSNPLQFLRRAYFKAKGIGYKKLGLVKPFEVVFAAGKVLLSSAHFAKRIIPVNIIDYDNYVKQNSSNERIVNGAYAVFLDINLPHQSDLKLIGLPKIDPIEYYGSLSRFFKILENRFSIRVVIAAHPKTDCDGNNYSGYAAYPGKTAELVKNADFVISHHSTSLSYAILNHKPVVFVYTNEMADKYGVSIMPYLRKFSDYLNAKLYNTDEINMESEISISLVDAERYEEYKYKYLTTYESEAATTQEILFKEFDAL